MNDWMQKLPLFLMFIPIFSFHEAAHAWVAYKCGDDTAKNAGRLTLNPWVHVDMYGTIIVPAVSIFVFGAGFIGWAKPIPIDLNQLRNYRRDHVLVALAGPASNFVLAWIVLLLGHLLAPEQGGWLELCATFATLSVFLGVFNLLPIPPLDGYIFLQHAFRLPEDLPERGGFIWLVILLVAIQLEPVRAFLWAGTSLILKGLGLLSGFPI